MSTILKSLKKLEQEKEAPQYPVHAGPGAVASSGGPSKWTKVTWIRRSIVALLILGLGATTIYFYRQTQSHPSAAQQAVVASQQQVKTIDKGAVEKPSPQKPAQIRPRPVAKAQETRPQQIQEPVRRPAVAPEPRQRPAIRQKEVAQPIVLPSKRPSDVADATPNPKPAVAPVKRPSPPPKLPTRRQQVAPNQQRRPVPPAPPKTQPSDTYDSVRPLTDGRLKIHAIVWSDNKDDRMAVVNTQILHEGDTVSGFSIVAIRQDDVVVRGEGGGLFKVIFGRP